MASSSCISYPVGIRWGPFRLREAYFHPFRYPCFSQWSSLHPSTPMQNSQLLECQALPKLYHKHYDSCCKRALVGFPSDKSLATSRFIIFIYMNLEFGMFVQCFLETWTNFDIVTNFFQCTCCNNSNCNYPVRSSKIWFSWFSKHRECLWYIFIDIHMCLPTFSILDTQKLYGMF